MTKKEHHECHECEHHHHHEHCEDYSHMAMACYDPIFRPGIELAKAYVPIQCFTRQFSLPVALNRGTLFPELYRPYMPEQY